MNDNLKGKVALVTGATSGIGEATARRFASAGAHVALVGRNDDKLNHVIREINESGGEAFGIVADVTSDAERIVVEAVERFRQLDVLVNSAGILTNGTVENTTLESWDEMLDVNLRAVFRLMQRVVPHLQKTTGNIVNVSSVTGLRAFPGVLAYCVSKAGLDQLTRCAALELAAQKIRVNAVNPGVVRTEVHRRSGMDDGSYEQFLECSRETHPLGRVGEASEVAELILFLASPRAAWITGATYSIDGGRAQTCAR